MVGYLHDIVRVSVAKVVSEMLRQCMYFIGTSPCIKMGSVIPIVETDVVTDVTTIPGTG